MKNLRKLNEEIKKLLEEFEPYYTIVGRPGEYTYNYTVDDSTGGTWWGDRKSPGYFDTKEDAINSIKRKNPDAKIIDTDEIAKEKYQSVQDTILDKLNNHYEVNAEPGIRADEIVIGNKLYDYWKTNDGGYGFSIWSKDKSKIIDVGPIFANNIQDLIIQIYRREMPV